MDIKIKYFSNIYDIKQKDGSDWIDLRSAENVHMKKGEYRLIRLGVAIKLPNGYEAHMAPRSSTFKTWHIIQTNSIGIIDESYCGDTDEWMFPALALEDTTIHTNDRICQFRIVKKQPEINFIKTEKMDSDNRGGFGSTGKS